MKDKKELTPEEKDALIAKLENEKQEQADLIAELNEKSKVSIAIPTVKVDGKTYRVLVPMFYDGKENVKTESLPEGILKGLIGEALVEVK